MARRGWAPGKGSPVRARRGISGFPFEAFAWWPCMDLVKPTAMYVCMPVAWTLTWTWTRTLSSRVLPYERHRCGTRSW